MKSLTTEIWRYTVRVHNKAKNVKGRLDGDGPCYPINTFLSFLYDIAHRVQGFYKVV